MKNKHNFIDPTGNTFLGSILLLMSHKDLWSAWMISMWFKSKLFSILVVVCWEYKSWVAKLRPCYKILAILHPLSVGLELDVLSLMWYKNGLFSPRDNCQSQQLDELSIINSILPCVRSKLCHTWAGMLNYKSCIGKWRPWSRIYKIPYLIDALPIGLGWMLWL